MAKKAKEVIEKKPVTAEDLQFFVKEAVKQTQSAADYASSAGGYIKNQIDRLGLNGKAAKMAVKLSNMEEGKRQTFLRDVLHYCFLLGHFDQLDMFDDTGKILTEILDRIETTDNTRTTEADPAVTQFN